MLQGGVYICTNEENINLFVANPDKYLLKERVAQTLQICILGATASGKSTQAKLIAQKYNLDVISIDDILYKWQHEASVKQIVSAEEAAFRGTNDMFEKIVEELGKGGVISTEHMTEIVKYGLQLYSDKGMHSSGGWILDDYPKTEEQAKSLLVANIIPNYVVHIDNNVDSKSILERIDRRLCDAKGNPITGDAAALPIKQLPFYNRMYAGITKSFAELDKALDAAGAKIINVKAEDAVNYVFNDIVRELDPFVPRAVPISPKVDQYPDSYLGAVKDYCPVTLKTSNVLIKGSRAFGAKYMNRIYYFVDDDARMTFCREPKLFTENIKPPPTRLFFFGPTGSGKTTYIGFLSKKWNIPSLQFKDVVYEYAETQDEVLRRDLTTAGDDAMKSSVIIDVTKYLFSSDKYKNTGFFLEGFPSSKSNLEAIVKSQLVADAFIHFKTSPDISAKRILPALRKELGDKRLVAEELSKATGLPFSELDMFKNPDKRNEAETNDIFRRIAMTEEELFADVMAVNERETNQVADVVSALEALGPLPTIEIDANRCIRPVMAQLERKLRRYINYRKGFLAHATSINTKQSDLLLRLGVKYYSPIGKYCPVTLKKNNNLSASSHGTKPVIYGDHIYFTKNLNSKREFILNPLAYLFKSPPQPLVSPTACILGPPKSGKTKLAESISTELDCVHLTIPGILQSILDGKEITALHDDVKNRLEKGESVPDTLIVEAILLATARITNAGRGWILDGYPVSQEQSDLLEKSGFLPQVYCHLQLDSDEIYKRALADFSVDTASKAQRMNAAAAIDIRREAYSKDIDLIELNYQRIYANWINIDARASKWALKDELQHIIADGIQKRQNYLDLKSKGAAAPISGIALSKIHILNNLGKYKEYCPVSYIDYDELRKAPPGKQFLAEYREVFYCMSSENELKAFLENPKKYYNAKELPTDLPKTRTKAEVKQLFPKQIELKGYCPVTFAEGADRFVI